MNADRGSWFWQLEHLIRNREDLERFLGRGLAAQDTPSSLAEDLEMEVTPYYAGLIRADDPHDPILRQILPSLEELERCPGTSMDPLAEGDHEPVRGVVHRYPDRVLLLTTGFCPTRCRFCMRKRTWFRHAPDKTVDPEAALAYIGSDKNVRDVILSGGDPLFLPPRVLEAILAGLKGIPHVKVVRIHSRTPATLPMRVDEELAGLLSAYKPIWFITHFNHPRELAPAALTALKRLTAAGMHLNNQSVLLRGVNDSASILAELSVKLLEGGVRPYYLHQVDQVAGLEHFRVPIQDGMALVRSLFGKVSGLGIPRYVLDLPGGKGKVPLMPDFCRTKKQRAWTFDAPLGGEVEITTDQDQRSEATT